MLIDRLRPHLIKEEGLRTRSSGSPYTRYFIATAFIDQLMLQCADYMNMETKEACQQVVLVGAGLAIQACPTLPRCMY
jgi:hypothetical protein